MNRKSIFVAGTLLIAGLAGSAAQAHQWGCWSQADRNVRIRNASGGAAASAAISDWNNMTILNISSVSSGEEIYVFNGNSGPNGWGGLATITNYSGCTILRATAQVNTYYFSSTSNSARGVHCQEIGHGFGLDHSNDGGCMGGGYWYSIANAYRPVSHNVNDIAAMYANKHDDHEHPTVGPESDAPRFHANWVNTPHTLGQAARMSSDVVVATVDYVTDGEPIRTVHEDGVQVIPTQRVHFTVKRRQKGSMAVGESFVLFQNGNEENRFDEDPSYKVGKRYLLFLTPRPDGTYLVIAPEGRYQVTPGGLVPATHKRFAAGLEGASLSDVLTDLTQVLVQTPDPQ